MTLEQAVTRLRSRLTVDLEAEVDIEDNEVATEELMTAAQEFSRDSYAYWQQRSTLTLSVKTTPDLGIFDTLSECAHRIIFIPRLWGVHVNGTWLNYMEPADYDFAYADYWNLSATSTPSHWTYVSPEQIQIAPAPNATAVAASDNYVRGFREHAVYTYNQNKDDELEGANVLHRLIVIKAALNLSEGYVSSEQGFRRRASYEKTYANETARYKQENLERIRPLNRAPVMGTRRRIFSFGRSR